MTQKKAPLVALDGRRQRQVAKEVLVLLRERLQRVLPCGFRHRAERRRTLGVNVITHGVIVVAAYDQCRALSHAANDMSGFRAIVDQIAEHPQFIVRLGHGVQCLSIAVNVGDDQDFHSEIVGSRATTAPPSLRYQNIPPRDPSPPEPAGDVV